MAFNFARLKNWLGYENLKATDVNAEFNNIISKAGADTLSSANSTNGSTPTVNAMQTTANPGGVGTETLAQTLQTDIQQLRYQLNAIIGSQQWYSAPANSIATLNNNFSSVSFLPQSRITAGRKSVASSSTDQAMFLVPDGTAATINLKCASTNFSAYFNGTLQTFTVDIPVTSLSTAPSSNNTCLVNDTSLSGAQSTKIQGERGTQITIDNIGTGITALNGTWAAFKHSTEYFTAYVDTTNNRLIKAFRGVGFNSSDVWQARTTVSDDDTITLMKMTWLFATYDSATPGLALTYNNPTVAYTQPSGPAIGDYWYDLTNNTWKVFSGTVFVSTSAVFVGICIQDSSGCKAARSADIFQLVSNLNTIELEYLSSSIVQSTRKGTRVSVYGSQYNFDHTVLQWSTSSNMDAGLSVSASTTYVCYVTDLGNLVISDVYPTERKYDLQGGYHPAKPWRCVGEFQTDGSSNIKNDTTLTVGNHWNTVLPALSVGASQIAPIAVTLQSFTSTGTTAGYVFNVTAANATIGATYTNNAQTFTVLGTIASGTLLFCTSTGAPGASGTLTKATGSGDATITFSAAQTLATYTTPASARYLRVRLVGAGGGGTGSSTTGGDGFPTVFGINLLVGGNGLKGITTGGGSPTGAIPSSVGSAIGFTISGSLQGSYSGSVNNTAGGPGGVSAFGGSGAGGVPSVHAGLVGVANSGGGGGGGAGAAGSGGCSGGCGGGYVDAIINSPSATYYYSVGVGGAAGTGSVSTVAGAGADGIIVVEEHYV